MGPRGLPAFSLSTFLALPGQASSVGIPVFLEFSTSPLWSNHVFPPVSLPASYLCLRLFGRGFFFWRLGFVARWTSSLSPPCSTVFMENRPYFPLPFPLAAAIIPEFFFFAEVTVSGAPLSVHLLSPVLVCPLVLSEILRVFPFFYPSFRLTSALNDSDTIFFGLHFALSPARLRLFFSPSSSTFG